MKYVAVKFIVAITVLFLVPLYLPADVMSYAYIMTELINFSQAIFVFTFSGVLLSSIVSVVLLPFLTSSFVRCFGAILFCINTLIILAYSEAIGTNHITTKFLAELFDLVWREPTMVLEVLPK